LGSTAEYVAQRKAALEQLQTQHLFSNLEIVVVNYEVRCRCSALILRRLDKNFFNTHAIHEFTYIFQNETWLISKIKQRVLWNEGDSEIHLGLCTPKF